MDMLQLAFKKYNYIKLKLAILSNKSFTTIMIATLVQDVLKNYGFIIYNEAHKHKCVSLLNTLSTINNPYTVKTIPCIMYFQLNELFIVY